ncbi:MAG: bifunctional folylpolyglutamate synthase/dihydrofolate synthase [Sphingomonadales bacterium]
MDYQQTLDYLFSKLPMFSRLGAAAYKNDLSNTVAMCEALGNPQEKIRTIHVAGTNGKGSVSHMLAAILQSNGYKTGLYTSPHLYDFRERIKVNGTMIGEQAVVDFTRHIRPLVEKIEPSFFELTVAMAFDHFAREKVDIAIIETGLGGRLDSTNIIIPILSVITNIDFDHMQLLGDTLEKIAFEKAGIIKQGVPVVIGEPTATTLPVFTQKATSENALLSIATDKRIISHFEWKDDTLRVQIAQEGMPLRDYQLDLSGIYQIKNVLTVLAAITQLQELGWAVSEKGIEEGLATTRSKTGLGGRWQRIGKDPSIILDVAHNEAGMRQLQQQLLKTSYQNLHVILGVVRDKSVAPMLKLLPKDAVYYFTKAQLPRALPEHDLAILARSEGLTGACYDQVATALKAAKANASAADLIVICGSIFLAAEVNPHEENGQ